MTDTNTADIVDKKPCARCKGEKHMLCGDMHFRRCVRCKGSGEELQSYVELEDINK